MINTPKKPISRSGRYALYDRLLQSLPPRSMTKRPKYLHSIGIFRGLRGDTAWVKIRLPHGAAFQGKHYEPGASLEIKVGNLASYDWAELEALYLEYQGKADRGELLETQTTPTFKVYAEEWLINQKTKQRGFKTSLGIVRNHLLAFFGEKPLNTITPANVNRWQSHQLATHQEATVKRQKVVLASILNTAFKHGLIESNPCVKSDGFRIPDKMPRALSLEEIAAFVSAAEKTAEWLPDYIWWALLSGMRKSEIHGLMWSHIVNTKDRTYIQLITGKTQKVRTVTCNPAMQKILERQMARSGKKEGRIFNVPLITLRRKWAEARLASGVKDITIQSMRSTNATFAAIAGVDLKTLAGRLGHGSLMMLDKRYAALVGASEVNAAQRIQDALSTVLPDTLRQQEQIISVH